VNVRSDKSQKLLTCLFSELLLRSYRAICTRGGHRPFLQSSVWHMSGTWRWIRGRWQPNWMLSTLCWCFRSLHLVHAPRIERCGGPHTFACILTFESNSGSKKLICGYKKNLSIIQKFYL